MKLYLMQHAEAKPKSEDTERHLTQNGIKILKKVANFAKSNISPELISIFHSGKTRTKQTAEIVGEYFKPEVGTSQIKGLKPLDPPTIIAKILEELEDDIMLIGHLPHLEKLCGLLIAGDENKNVIDFHNAGIVCLEKYEDKWVVDIEILPENL